MKNPFSVAILTVALGSGAAFAQALPAADGQATAQHARHHDPHRAAMRIGHRLGLSPDQTARLEPILADRRGKLQAVRSNASLTEDQRRQQMHAIRQDTRAHLAGVLTPDQMRQLKAMHRHHGRSAEQPAGV